MVATPADARRNRIIFGCLALFAAVGAGVFATLGGTLWYALSTPRQITVASMIGPETIGVVRIRGATSDPGVAALVRACADGLTAMQVNAQKSKPLPPALQWTQPFQSRNNQRSIGYLVPREAGVIVELVAGGTGTGAVLVFSPRQLPRIYERGFSWLLSQEGPGVVVTRRGGIDVVQTPSGEAFAFAGGTFLFSESRDAMFAVVDRIDHPPAASTVSERLAALDGGLDGEAVLRAGAPMAPDGRFCELLATTIDVVDVDRVDLTFDASCGSGTAEERLAFVAGADAAIRALLPPGMTLTTSPAPTDAGVAGSAELAGLGTWMKASMSGAPAGATPAAAPAAPVATPDESAGDGE